ncbi:MAG: rhamnulokinase [Lachnospiraceae bacterium]|nr:rhamnulokinase [Lachnospiraceae bacterium]
MPNNVLAFDFGAGSIRAILFTLDGGRLTSREVHRFDNVPIEENGRMCWDIDTFVRESKVGLNKALAYGAIDSVGIDTWGGCYALLKDDGQLWEKPIYGRGNVERTSALRHFQTDTQKDRVYDISGAFYIGFGILSQLSRMGEDGPFPGNIKAFLMMPDLIAYYLTGVCRNEETVLGSQAFLDARARAYSKELFGMGEIPEGIFPGISPHGGVIGYVRDGILPDGAGKIPVITVAGHDTASACVAVPSAEEEFAYISSGTNSVVSTQLDAPVINELTKKYRLATELGYGNKWRLTMNIRAGMWLAQQCRAYWQSQGIEKTFAQLQQAAYEAAPFRSFIDPAHPPLFFAGGLPDKMNKFLADTGQEPITSIPETMRCIYESLALKYRFNLDSIEECTGKHFGKLYIVGGGSQADILNQMTANACKRTVVAGPAEAASIGNALVQLIGLGAIKDIAEGRRVVAGSFQVKTFEPQDTDLWDRAAERFAKVAG